MATRKFEMVFRPDHDKTMRKAELTVKGDGIWAPEVSISVYKWDNLGVGVHVEAHNFMGENHEHGAVYLHYNSVQEGWEKFQMLRELFGLKGV